MKEETKTLMEEILSKENLNRAYLQVKRNGGTSGIDGMQVGGLLVHLRKHGETIIEALFSESYQPKPVRRVEIPKPDGGKRQLGIPTVLDRMIQQAMSQILSPIYEKKFSNYSYGFRPERNCHQAILQAKEYIEEGYEYVVDIDLEKFFDRVNHDKLMSLIAKDITDKKVLRLIRKYLESGAMTGGLYESTEEGTPQGGPLSPLLSNIMLHELDKELEKRGHKFCRYADDCNIYVKSHKAGQRVMESTKDFIERKLKLKVNVEKSAVGTAYERKFLGFGFHKGKDGTVKIKAHKKSVAKLKAKIRKIVSRSNGKSMHQRITALIPLLRGWGNYYRLDELKTMHDIDGWIRTRLRACFWKMWKKAKTKQRMLKRLGLSENQSWRFSFSRKGYTAIAYSPILKTTLTNNYFENLGFIGLVKLTSSS